jgi:hypothetical protein
MQTQETPAPTTTATESFTFIAQMATMAEENHNKYQDILDKMHRGKMGVKGKPTPEINLQMSELTDQYFFIKQRLDKVAKRMKFAANMKSCLAMAKVGFPSRKKYNNIIELKYDVSDVLFWTVAQLESVVMASGIEFLKQYDGPNWANMYQMPAFMAWLWARVQVVLEVIMIEKTANGTSSTVLKQHLSDYLSGYLITDSTYEVYQRKFYEP